MKTITEITIATTRDDKFVIDYDLDGYEGSTEFFTSSAVRIFVEDTVSFAVDRETRKFISEFAHDLIINKGSELVTIDVLDLRDGDGYFDADFHWIHHGITHTETLSF